MQQEQDFNVEGIEFVVRTVPFIATVMYMYNCNYSVYIHAAKTIVCTCTYLFTSRSQEPIALFSNRMYSLFTALFLRSSACKNKRTGLTYMYVNTHTYTYTYIYKPISIALGIRMILGLYFYTTVTYETNLTHTPPPVHAGGHT